MFCLNRFLVHDIRFRVELCRVEFDWLLSASLPWFPYQFKGRSGKGRQHTAEDSSASDNAPGDGKDQGECGSENTSGSGGE